MHAASFLATSLGVREPQIFTAIPPTLPEDAVYRRLGRKQNITSMTSAQKNEIHAYLHDAVSLIELKGSARTLTIISRDGGRIELEDGTVFESASLAKMLEGCQEVLLMAATSGSAIMQVIASDIAGANITRGVVLDATASEVVDAALSWITAYFNQVLLRQGRVVTRKRFSAGYGDLALATQRELYRLLQLERIGIELTESCILIPEKSVSAIAGIRGGYV